MNKLQFYDLFFDRNANGELNPISEIEMIDIFENKNNVKTLNLNKMKKFSILHKNIKKENLKVMTKTDIEENNLIMNRIKNNINQIIVDLNYLSKNKDFVLDKTEYSARVLSELINSIQY